MSRKIPFNVYVINLKQDWEKWRTIQDNFKETNLKLTRFDAVNGKSLSSQDGVLKKKQVTVSCRHLCTDSMIGNGLSHIKLAQYISRYDKYPFAVVLEDDVKPLNNNIASEIIKTVQSTPKNWDIIKIFYHGACKNPNHPLFICGATCGYIISKSGAEKLGNLKLNYHIDWQLQQTRNIHVNLSNKILLAEDSTESSIADNNFLNRFDMNHNFKIKGFNYISWYLNQPVCKIPFTNVNISFIKLLVLCYLVVFILFKFKGFAILSSILIIFILLVILNNEAEPRPEPRDHYSITN